MWKLVRERLLSGGAILLMLGWLVCALGIAVWVDGATNLDLGHRGRGALFFLLFLLPLGVVVALDEFVIRRIRYGRPVPGRRRRGDLNADQLRELDQRLKRSPREHKTET